MSNSYNADRVRRSTSQSRQREIDRKIEERVRWYSSQPREVLSQRIRELEFEWSIERYIEVNASSLALAGAVLGATVDKRFLIIPMMVGGFLLQHAIQGWCPPVPLFRSMGIRTRREIEREKFALKAIRGDFDGVNAEEHGPDPDLALQAVTL
jgi:hypothetical protein